METDVVADIFGLLCYLNTENRRGWLKSAAWFLFISWSTRRDFKVIVSKEMFIKSMHKWKDCDKVIEPKN